MGGVIIIFGLLISVCAGEIYQTLIFYFVYILVYLVHMMIIERLNKVIHQEFLLKIFLLILAIIGISFFIYFEMEK